MFILRLRPCRRPLWQPVDCLFADRRSWKGWRKLFGSGLTQWINMKNMDMFILYLIIGFYRFLAPFRVPRWPFWVHLEVLGHHFGIILQSGVPQMFTERSWKAPRWVSHIFDGFWVPLWRPFWITFWYFLSFEASDTRFGLHAWCLLIFNEKFCDFWCPKLSKV